jgi:hypothetical protein
MRTRRTGQVVISALLLAGASLASVGAQDQRPPETPRGQSASQKPPKEIWPAGLADIAGHYIYVQVASPGGLWNRSRGEARQASINEVPAAFREKLLGAYIDILDLQTPTEIEASEYESPTKRGMIRRYTETGKARLVIHGLPGIGMDPEDKGEYKGPAEISIDHAMHSNPSVTGVLKTRTMEEGTWGTAILDFAHLGAFATPTGASPTDRKPDAGKPGAAKPAKPGAAQAEPGPSGEDDPRNVVIANARILRSGQEIFAFVEWSQKEADGEHRYNGTVRLLRVPPGTRREDLLKPPSRPQPRPRPSTTT